MPERPLLLFPTPERASRSTLGGGTGSFHRPSHHRQGARLTPIFNQLQEAFASRRIEVQQTTAGIDPEQVLVIETIGSVQDFSNAVRRIEGFEWMCEIELDEITPDEDFFYNEAPGRDLSGRLYLVLTNQRALDEMLSLWRQYQEDPNFHFARGLTKFRDVFACLKDIRRWGIQDRLHETQIIDIWKEELQHDANRIIKFETELWFRSTPEKQNASKQLIETLVAWQGGRVISQCIISEIAYHSILAELPALAIQGIINNPVTELVKCDNIMFFRPVGQVSSGDEPIEGDTETIPAEDKPLPVGSPTIGVLDGLPLENHRLLSGRLIVDDPDDWAANYPAADRVHGTAMTSLIVHGDLNEVSPPLQTPVYVRPIMRPNPIDWRTPRPEVVPEDVLCVDLIHRAVKRMIEGDVVNTPTAPTVKIINLSIGDPSRQFNQVMSPLGRLLDWLSYKYNVLFIISAGNHPSDIILDISREDFECLHPAELESLIVNSLHRDARNRKLLSPSESINGITVGAIHYDNSTVVNVANRFDPYSTKLPSPVTSFGSGYRRSIKPDLVYPGGKQWYRTPLIAANPTRIQPARLRSAPGNKVASTGTIVGHLDQTAYCCGTSNATALLSRSAAICLSTLQQIFNDMEEGRGDFSNISTVLLKGMLVHGCHWGDIGDLISSILGRNLNGHQLQSWISRWIGYGTPEISRVLECTEQRASLIGYGQLSDGEAHVFKLPLPPSLGARREWRRLTITLSWLSPISATTQKYRVASLWFETINNNLAPVRQDAQWQAVRRGTIQHEVFEGESAIPFAEGDNIQIKVNCRKDAANIQTPIKYGVVVTLEVREGVNIAVYDEIRVRIAQAVQIQPVDQG